MYICDIDTENLILNENNIPTLDINWLLAINAHKFISYSDDKSILVCKY